MCDVKQSYFNNHSVWIFTESFLSKTIPIHTSVDLICGSVCDQHNHWWMLGCCCLLIFIFMFCFVPLSFHLRSSLPQLLSALCFSSDIVSLLVFISMFYLELWYYSRLVPPVCFYKCLFGFFFFELCQVSNDLVLVFPLGFDYLDTDLFCTEPSCLLILSMFILLGICDN